MGPGRRRGAKGLKTTNELSVGDLVLAKVKGFPAWPAQIGRPEEWDRAPDPKKYFVQFYGTAEIAFVAPVDIQEFTIETKNKVVARCKGKTVKYFAQAVGEICEEFDKLQQKDSNSLEDESSENALAREDPSPGGVAEDGVEVDLKDGNDTNGLHQEMEVTGLDDHGSMLERCSQRQEVKSCENVKLCVSGEKNANLSPDANVKRRNKLKTNGASALKEELISSSTPSDHLFLEEGASEIKVEDVVTLAEQPRRVTHVEAQNVEGDSSPFKPTDHVKNADNEQKESTNGRKSEQVTGSKKKSDGKCEMRNVIGSVVPLLSAAHDKAGRYLKPSVSGPRAGNGVRNKIALDNGKQSSSYLDNCGGKKKLLKDKNHYAAVDDHVDSKTNSEQKEQIEQLPRKKKNIQNGRETQTFQNHEMLSPAKRSKCLDMADDATKLSLQTNRKLECKGLNFHGDKLADEEVKRSGPRGKMENRLTSGVQVSTADSSFTRDEDAPPPTKRRRRAVEDVSSSALIPENRIRKISVALKNDLSGSDSRRSSVTVPTKRRAVRIFEDNDDEAPKTPIHGGSAKKVLAAPKVLDASKKTAAPGESSAPCETLKKETHMLKDSSGKELTLSMGRPVAYLSPSSQQDMDKKLRKTRDTPVRSSPERLIPEEVSFKEGETVLPSTLRSPAPVALTKSMFETQKANEDSTKLFNNTDRKKLRKTRDTPVRSSPERLISEEVSFKLGETILPPTLRSPARVDLTKSMVETQKANEDSTKLPTNIDRKKLRKTRDTSVCSSPERFISEEVSFKEGETVLPSTLRSPAPVALIKATLETQKSNEDSTKLHNNTDRKKLRKTRDTPVRSSPERLISEEVSFKEGETVLPSTLRSPAPIALTKTLLETQKANEDSTKLPNNTDRKKTLAGQDKGGVGATDSFNSSLTKPASGRNKLSLSGERNKATFKSNSQIEDSVPSTGRTLGVRSLSSERLEAGREDIMSSSVDLSMKHLIAAAQAKRKQAHMQNSHINSLSTMALNVEATRGSHSPASPAQLLGSYNMLQSHSSLASPSFDVHLPSITYQHESEELEEKRISSGNWAPVGSLSGGTEAAVARDAFEGMIETLSRTKESIGRATRLAIDCAKYGIANEVIELLIRKLESEPTSHRKVDLFFLVDSITQCSHSHKGIAGASYIPTVQAALPRLLGAAAPPGVPARENRRQCLKVLRLWLERKILPDSLLRPYMDEIGVANEDISSGVSFRRPSRAERAIDDPIREMDGMLVDEYGSNATFHLPGIFPPHAFADNDDEEEEDFPSNIGNEIAERSPADHTPGSKDLENHIMTPNERRHCILEDVDGELEMEDVSGHLKDERPAYAHGTFEVASSYSGAEIILESASNNLTELLLCEGSPPLPPNSPPQTPALPSSPPPPPPPSSPSPPPPPPPPSQLHPFASPLVGPPPAWIPQQPLPLQSSVVPQCLHPLLPSKPLTLSPVAYQQNSVSHEIGMATGMQPVQMAGNAPHGDFASRGDVYPQKSPCFLPVGVGNLREPSGYTSSKPLEYGQNDAYVNAQAPQHNQPFPPVNAPPYTQRPLHPNALPQNPPHFSYPKLPVQQHPPHPQHPYPPPYSLPNLPEVPRRYLADEHWRPRPVEFNNDHHQSSWIGAGRSCSGPPFVQEGYLRPPPERPPSNAFGFQLSTPSCPPAGTSIPGHGLSGRADMPSLSWRPV